MLTGSGLLTGIGLLIGVGLLTGTCAAVSNFLNLDFLAFEGL